MRYIEYRTFLPLKSGLGMGEHCVWSSITYISPWIRRTPIKTYTRIIGTFLCRV